MLHVSTKWAHAWKTHSSFSFSFPSRLPADFQAEPRQSLAAGRRGVAWRGCITGQSRHCNGNDAISSARPYRAAAARKQTSTPAPRSGRAYPAANSEPLREVPASRPAAAKSAFASERQPIACRLPCMCRRCNQTRQQQAAAGALTRSINRGRREGGRGCDLCLDGCCCCC